MQEVINFEETEDTPKVILDRENNNFEISGKSLPEDASKFFDPIHDWIEEYIKDPNPSTELILKLEYFNSASAKQIVDLLIKLEGISLSGKEVKITWFYRKEDELMEARGDEIKSVLDLPFELKVY